MDSKGSPAKNAVVKFIGLTQDEAEAVLDSGLFKIRSNTATRAFVLKLLSVIREFADDSAVDQAVHIVDHENNVHVKDKP